MKDVEKRRLIERINSIKASLNSANEQLNFMVENIDQFCKEPVTKVYVVYTFNDMNKEPEVVKVFKNYKTAVSFVKYSGCWMKEMEVIE